MSKSRRLPVYLLIVAVALTFLFDVFEFVHTYNMASNGASWSLFFVSMAESTVDIAALIAVYWMMRSALSRIEAVSKSKSEILSIVSHDLRSPLGVMLGLGQVLEETELKDDQRRLVRRILANGEHTLNLINNLLTQSALEGEGLKLHPRQICVDQTVHEAVDALKSTADKKQIRVQVEDHGEILAEVDPQKFRQMLDNLMTNAIKYSPEGKGIEVRLSQSRTSFEVAVHDQGPGLTPEETEAVFHKFSKVKNRPTGGEHSIGLGLSIARKMAELHGGRLYAESEGRGLGSTFRLQLPLSLR